MHPWEDAYRNETFRISTGEPSVVVLANEARFTPGCRALDLGCGNGRNSIYAASRGCAVDAVDVADLGWPRGAGTRFEKADIEDLSMREAFYDIVVMTRVIQYLPPEELPGLFSRIRRALKRGGALLMSYTRAGGIHDRAEIDVPKFSHEPASIRKILSERFAEVHISPGSPVSVHVGYSGPIDSYDLACVA